MTTDTVVIIRTHYFDEDVAFVINEFLHGSDFDVVVVVDETKETVNIPLPVKTIKINDVILKANGLPAHPQVGWRCGDYCFYLARQEFPEKEYFWLIEPDIYINTRNLRAFFKPFESSNADLLAMMLGPRSREWAWHNSINPYVKEVYGCLFGMVRLSGRAIDYLFEKRKIVSELFFASERPLAEFPNDESHVASFVINHSSFKWDDINNIRQCYRFSDTFFITLPFLKEIIQENGPDELIYHSVRPKTTFERSYNRYLDTIKTEPQLQAAIAALRHVEKALGHAARNRYADLLASKANELSLLGPAGDERIQTLTGSIITVKRPIPVSFFVSNKPDYIQSYHSRGLFYEREQLFSLLRLIRRDSTILDIGAHTGNHTIFFGLHVSPKKIICFEPNNEARDILQINIRLNTLQSITDLRLAPFALGERNIDAFIEYPSNNWGAGSIREKPREGMRSHITQVRTGDSLLAHENFDFIKIDVAEHSLPVLRGLKNTIDRSRCGLFVTALSDERADVAAFLDDLGYEILSESLAYFKHNRIVAIAR